MDRHVAGQRVAHAAGARDEGGGRLLGVLVVLERHVAATGQAALHPRPGLDLVEGLVEHDGVAAGLHGGAAAGVLRVALGDHPHAVGPGLRAPDGVDDHQVREQLEVLVLHGGGEDRRGGGQHEQRRQVERVGATHLLERLDHRTGHGVAGDAEGVDALALDGPPHLVRVEPPEEDHEVALEGEPEEAPLGGAVHQRRQVERSERGSRRSWPSRPATTPTRPARWCRRRSRHRGRRRRPPGATPRPWASRWCHPCTARSGRRRSARRSRARGSPRPWRPRSRRIRGRPGRR